MLSPIYEQLFYEDSYGFRPGKSQHQALEEVFQRISFKGKRYVIDADMQNYFGSINHDKLRELLDLRIRDKVTRKMIDKWLKAGILEEGRITYPDQGTPQGGSISPMLSNIYLHYAVDEWFNEQIRPRLKADAKLVRFADDCAPGNVPARWGNRPPAAGLRRQAANHRERLRSRAGVVSVTEKAEQNSVRYETEKTNESEPLMKRRKRRDVVKTGRQSLARDKLRGKSAYCRSGDRRKGGVMPFRACRCNPGTCRLDAKGAAQAADLQGPEYQCEAQGRISP